MDTTNTDQKKMDPTSAIYFTDPKYKFKEYAAKVLSLQSHECDASSAALFLKVSKYNANLIAGFIVTCRKCDQEQRRKQSQKKQKQSRHPAAPQRDQQSRPLQQTQMDHDPDRVSSSGKRVTRKVDRRRRHSDKKQQKNKTKAVNQIVVVRRVKECCDGDDPLCTCRDDEELDGKLDSATSESKQPSCRSHQDISSDIHRVLNELKMLKQTSSEMPGISIQMLNSPMYQDSPLIAVAKQIQLKNQNQISSMELQLKQFLDEFRVFVQEKMRLNALFGASIRDPLWNVECVRDNANTKKELQDLESMCRDGMGGGDIVDL